MSHALLKGQAMTPNATPDGRIVGGVTDQQGEVVPGATVLVISQDSKIKRDPTTDGNGAYAVRFLPPGAYAVIIQAVGFSSTSSPSATNGTLYAGAISVSTNETIQAVAIVPGFSSSAASVAAFTINLAPAATPVLSPAGGIFNATQTVTMTDTTPGAAI